MIVPDASALLEALLRTPSAAVVERWLLDPAESLHVPHLVDVEITQVLRRYTNAGMLDPERGTEALADLADLPLHRHPHDLLLRRVWSLRANFTAYDATYVALAELLDARLLTRDRRLAAAAERLIAVTLV
jgi:predicted nucleic acid-binding protein